MAPRSTASATRRSTTHHHHQGSSGGRGQQQQQLQYQQAAYQQQQYFHPHQQQSSTVPQSVPDTQIGVPPEDLATFRYHQHAALAAHQQQNVFPSINGHSNGSGGSTTSSTRGAPSSSATSSQAGPGRLLLDPTSLTLLSHHFDRVLYALQGRWAQLHTETQQAALSQSHAVQLSVQEADRQIERFEEIVRQVDEVRLEFEKIKRIGEIVKSFKARVEALERRI